MTNFAADWAICMHLRCLLNLKRGVLTEKNKPVGFNVNTGQPISENPGRTKRKKEEGKCARRDLYPGHP